MSNILPLFELRPSCGHRERRANIDYIGTVERLDGTLARSLRILQKDMLKNDDCMPAQIFPRNVRPFRQRFCFLLRKFSGLSPGELCFRLNEHADILKLHRYPSYSHFYPITPQFLSYLENDISKIFEYCSSGFAFGGIGTPTDEVAKAIADICGAYEEHEEFLKWCVEYSFG